MTKLILVRHGESVGNISDIHQGGGPGTDLTKLGKKQAKAVANRIKDEKIDVIYSSPTKRTIQTAEIINKYHNIKIKIEKKLKDRDFGILINQPKKFDDLSKDLKKVQKRRIKEEDFRIPDGESFTDVKMRAMKAVNNILKEHKNKTIVIVTHGNTIRSIVSSMLNIPLTETYKMEKSRTSCYTEIKINGKPELVKYLCIEHLEKI